MTTNHNTILTNMADEARHILKTTILDLDAFLALKGAARAARWRQFDAAAKFQAVALMIERIQGDWSLDEVSFWIAQYDERYGAAAAAETAAVLERNAVQHGESAAQAWHASEKDERTYHRRAATAYTNALIEYRNGVRPERLADGGWLLPSRRAGEAPHIVRMDGDWICSCKARAAMHWPIALVCAMDVAGELSCDPPAPEPNPLGDDEGDSYPYRAQQLGQRLAAARSLRYALVA